MKKTRKSKLVVSEGAVFEFMALRTGDRLRWLDEMRAFLSKTLPPKTKKIYDQFRMGR